MPQKGSNPILVRAWDILGSLTPTPNLRKPAAGIARKLLHFKRNTRKRLRMLRHYNHAFFGEYQFSPSDSPLIFHPRPRLRKRSGFLCLLCSDVGGGDAEDVLEMLSDGVGRRQVPETLLDYNSGGDDDSVDWRAERFIEKFYEEMRMQRQDSGMLQYTEMIQKS